jgi:hypothetical protein
VLCAYKGEEQDHAKDHGAEHQEHLRPWHHREECLRYRRADHLAGRARCGGYSKRHRAVLKRSGAADHRQDHAEAGAGDTKTNQAC